MYFSSNDQSEDPCNCSENQNDSGAFKRQCVSDMVGTVVRAGDDMWESKMAILLSRTHSVKKRLTILLRDVKEDLMK